MKKALILSLILSLLLSAAGCSLLNPAPKDFDVADYNMVISADEGFKEDTDGDWSLQITNYKSYISVMPFTYEELGDITPEEIYSLQNEDIFTRREDAKVLEEETKKTENGKTIIRKVFSAVLDGEESYYVCYLVDIPESEICAWVLCSTLPEYYDSIKEKSDTIVASLDVKE